MCSREGGSPVWTPAFAGVHRGGWHCAAAALLLLAGCNRAPETTPTTGAGADLETAAIARGVVADPASIDPVGVFASDSDRVCVVPAADGYRIGASVDYGEGQSCAASGSATGKGKLSVTFGEGCRFDAKIEGDRISFPAIVPAECDKVCTGRASLAALTATRLSHSAAEASSTIGAGGTALCR